MRAPADKPPSLTIRAANAPRSIQQATSTGARYRGRDAPAVVDVDLKA
jgi:hypothetical protein